MVQSLQSPSSSRVAAFRPAALPHPLAARLRLHTTTASTAHRRAHPRQAALTAEVLPPVDPMEVVLQAATVPRRLAVVAGALFHLADTEDRAAEEVVDVAAITHTVRGRTQGAEARGGAGVGHTHRDPYPGAPRRGEEVVGAGVVEATGIARRRQGVEAEVVAVRDGGEGARVIAATAAIVTGAGAGVEGGEGVKLLSERKLTTAE